MWELFARGRHPPKAPVGKGPERWSALNSFASFRLIRRDNDRRRRAALRNGGRQRAGHDARVGGDGGDDGVVVGLSADRENSCVRNGPTGATGVIPTAPAAVR
jgi:hypothetical protein